MGIYTRTGDGGDTGLLGGARVPKSHPRVEAYGAVDELNAALGIAAAAVEDEEIRGRITVIQNDLFAVGAALATPPTEGNRPSPTLPDFPVDRVGEMERWIDSADKELPPLREFVLPGGTSGAATLHFARTVCRRAERRVVELTGTDAAPEGAVRYLNRLSDLLFALARLANVRAGVSDTHWRKG